MQKVRVKQIKCNNLVAFNHMNMKGFHAEKAKNCCTTAAEQTI